MKLRRISGLWWLVIALGLAGAALRLVKAALEWRATGELELSGVALALAWPCIFFAIAVATSRRPTPPPSPPRAD